MPSRLPDSRCASYAPGTRSMPSTTCARTPRCRSPRATSTGCTVECWLHGSRFDVRTGEPTGPPAFEPVTRFPVAVDGDDVYVTVP